MSALYRYIERLRADKDKIELCSHRVFVTGVPVSIHRYLDLSLAVARLARVVLCTGSDKAGLKTAYIPCPDELCLVEDDTVPLHLGK